MPIQPYVDNLLGLHIDLVLPFCLDAPLVSKVLGARNVALIIITIVIEGTKHGQQNQHFKDVARISLNWTGQESMNYVNNKPTYNRKRQLNRSATYINICKRTNYSSRYSFFVLEIIRDNPFRTLESQSVFIF